MPASYYAVSAKVHALYGRRMTSDDYRQLMNKSSVAEAAAFLQTQKGYREVLSGISTASMHRDDLESVLRSSMVEEYRRIFSFMNMTDKEIMRYAVYRGEQTAILTTMRHLTSTVRLDPVTTWASVLQQNSQLDLNGLEHAETFTDIVHAAEHTIYGSALQRIVPSDNTNPTAAFVDNMMQVVYYARMYKLISNNYKGDTKKILRQSMDNEVDLLNLVQFLRLKKHFSDEDIQRYSFPLPSSAKLKKEYIQQLLASDSYESAYQLVLNGPYGKVFRSISSPGVEAYYYTAQYNFARRQLRAADPTVYTPFAYLTLKEIELRNIISIIECIRYGGDPNAYVTLIGI